ncbi:zinc finger protein 484-like [Aricia agestis]|uniref:zinc finger protein 484-like n=1 Tax=Aricia agestis TaxID=91739 RepID=UPI001C209525|nr:zinc finger protein 484-like [Aricia agestis]
MSDNDDLYMVIVGDDGESVSHIKIDPNFEIKQEKLDDDDEVQIKVEQLLDSAAEHGEVLDLDEENFNMLIGTDDDNKFNIETEHEDRESNIDFIVDDDTQESAGQDSDDEFVPSDRSEYESDDEVKSDNEDIKDEKIRKKTKFRRRGKNRQEISYVQYLRDEYNDLRDDEELLINCIVELMRQVQRPEPPEDQFIMNGIMFECIHCEKQSTSIPNAQRHYQDYHGERYLYCYACGSDFRSSTNLYKHEKRCNAADIKIVLKARAQVLGRKGRSRPYIPEFIDQKEDRKPIKRYYCTECSASFVTKYGAESHLRMHRGERPYVCPHCPRAYTSQTTLARHKLKHGSQEYICDHCSRSFKLKAALILHMDTHAPLKKYPCLECPRRYSQKSALLVHVNRDHRLLPLPFPCQICPKRYPRMSVLKNHMKKAHGMLLMSRKMFFKQLPLLTKTQIDQAKVILKSAEDPYADLLYSDKISNPEELYE